MFNGGYFLEEYSPFCDFGLLGSVYPLQVYEFQKYYFKAICD